MSVVCYENYAGNNIVGRAVMLHRGKIVKRCLWSREGAAQVIVFPTRYSITVLSWDNAMWTVDLGRF